MLSKPITERLQWFERLAEQHIVTQHIEDKALAEKDIYWDILRADLIHPVCSGNKFFKLKYYLLEAIQKEHTYITTYGGAWSNHIAATAFAAAYCGLKSRGIIRGEKPHQLSETLLSASGQGMELTFMPREEFSSNSMTSIDNGPEFIIPHGGYGQAGMKGASEMLRFTRKENYTHICCACGTGTMLAGLMWAFSGVSYTENKIPQFIGIPVVKDETLTESIERLILPFVIPFNLEYDFSFGGYAKKNAELISFMNSFYAKHLVPTDFVYTGKLMFALNKMLDSGFFPAGSRILAIHSGGLQGNKSLKKGTLCY